MSISTASMDGLPQSRQVEASNSQRKDKEKILIIEMEVFVRL